MVTLVDEGKLANVPYKTFQIDNASELNSIDLTDVSPFSIVLVCKTNPDIYMLNGSKQWIKM